MKTKWTIGTLGVLLLVASLVSNAWLLATLRTYRYNANHGWFTMSSDGVPEYPISGLSSVEVKQMLDQIDARETTAGRQYDKCVLTLQVLDKNRAEITTGKHDAPLSGGGNIYRFNRTPAGWKFDEKSQSGWVS